VAGDAERALLAGVGQKILVAADEAADSVEAFPQAAPGEVFLDDIPDEAYRCIRDRDGMLDSADITPSHPACKCTPVDKISEGARQKSSIFAPRYPRIGVQTA